MRPINWLCTLLAGISILLGCSSGTGPDNQLAGGDDFPNAHTGLGKAVAAAVSSQGNWEQFSTIPDTIPDALDAESLFTGKTDADNGLAKRAANAAVVDTLIWDYSDSAQGTAIAYRVYEDWTVVISDTFVAIYDSSAVDSTFGNETYRRLHGQVFHKWSQKRLSFHLADTDTNGYLDSGWAQLATPVWGAVDIVCAEAHSPDTNNFAEGSTVLVPHVTYFRIAGADTAFVHELRDEDGDGTVIDTAADSNLIAYHTMQANPFPLPGQPQRTDLRIRAGLEFSPTGKLVLRRAAGSRTFPNGRFEQVELFGTGTDSILKAHDTGMVRLTTVSPTNTQRDTTRMAFKVALGPDILDPSGHALAGFSYTAIAPAESVSRLSLAFTAKPPIKLGDTEVSGTLQAEARFTDGTTGSLAANVSPGLIDAVYTDRQGDTTQVHWDSAGEPLE